MISFVTPYFPLLRPAHYPGSVRFEPVAVAKEEHRGINSEKSSGQGLSAMLLAAMASALLVVADQLMSSWADGHLLVAWVALWLVGFAALAMFAGAARRFARAVVAALDAWSERLSNAKSDQRLWAVAKTDPRVMSELSAAVTHNSR